MNCQNHHKSYDVLKKSLLIIGFMLSFSGYYAQNEVWFTKKEIIEDITTLVADIKIIHPNPFHSIQKSTFEKEIKKIKSEIPDSNTKIDAWKKYYKILASLKEGHCYFLPPLQEIGSFQKFPYTIKIDALSNSFIVKSSLEESNPNIIGKRIISINGISSDSLISIFKESTSAENEALFLYMNETHFDISIYAIFGSREYFEVEFINNGKVEKVNCKSIKHLPEKKKPNYTFEIVDEKIGLIDMNRLNSYTQFKKFCKTTFKSLRKKEISKLIIDFRGNGGGDSKIGDELIKYIADKPFIQYQKAIAKVSAISRKEFKYPFKSDTLIVKELAGSEKHLIKPYPENKRFSGNVFVLIDGGTFSSAGSTVWCIDHYNLATIIGSETGGTGIHYGYPIKRQLPNTGLTYFISHMKWYQIGADENSYHGLYPEYKINTTIEDIINHRDATLDFTFKMIGL